MTYDLLADLQDTADALTRPQTHRHPRHGWSASRHKVKLPDHVVELPNLLQQVADTAFPGSRADTGDFVMRPIPGSRPPLQIQAISLHAEISVAVIRWCWQMRLDPRDTVDANIRLIVGRANQLDHDDLTELLGELRRWVYRCELVTGWRDPDPQLQAPCPHCGERELRVNVTEKTARCVACRSRWAEDVDPDRGIYAIGVLGEHIAGHRRVSSAAAEGARQGERDRKARLRGEVPAA